MSDLWYRELGFYNNPFSIKPAAYTNDVIGHNLKSMFKSIDSGQLIFIAGPFGTGKTTMLKHIIGKFGGERKVVYFSCGLERSMDVSDLIHGAGSFLNKVAGRSPKDLIFLVDEATDILPKDAEELFTAYQDGAIKSIVFVGTDIPSRKFPAGMSTAIKDNVINLHNLPAPAAVQLIRKRIGNLPILNDAIIREAHKKADGNARLLLEYCEELCRLAVSRGLDSITKSEVEELFPSSAPKHAPVKRILKKKKRIPLEQAIEEAVFEVEDEAPVVEGISQIGENDPLPSGSLYESPVKRKKRK
ncbi:MAG: ATP-binding protein [Nanoarchaeota archaeon]